MALCSSLSHVPPIITSPPKLTSKFSSSSTPHNLHGIFTKSKNKFLLNAGFNLVEPDLNEDPRDQFRTNGIEPVICYIIHFASFFVCHLFCFVILAWFYFVWLLGRIWVWNIWWSPHFQWRRRKERYSPIFQNMGCFSKYYFFLKKLSVVFIFLM